MPRPKATDRKRVLRACASCKRRKEKCDGLQPCGRCKHRNTENQCTFLVTPLSAGSGNASSIPTHSRDDLLDHGVRYGSAEPRRGVSVHVVSQTTASVPN